MREKLEINKPTLWNIPKQSNNTEKDWKQNKQCIETPQKNNREDDWGIMARGGDTI